MKEKKYTVFQMNDFFSPLPYTCKDERVPAEGITVQFQ